MVKIHKYEAIGIGVSIGLMALALFLMRFSGNLTNSPINVAGQNASVIMAENGVEGMEAALSAGMSGGRVDKLIITDVVLGDGEEVKKGSEIEVNYIGTLQNGQEFDNTYKKGSTFTFKVGDSKVIDGWNEGVVGMKEGGKRIIVIPSDMAYGRSGYGPIPGNATVVYAIEVVGVKR